MTSRLHRFFLIACLAQLVLLTACDSTAVMDEHIALPDNRWPANHVVKMEAGIEDTSATYNIYINLRNAGSYSFSNLFLFMNTYTPDGALARDTIELVLADDQGQWKGDGMGDIWDNRILFKKDQRFPMPGTYRFELEQAMRIDPLPGVMDAGIRIEKNVAR
ncbi:MAG: gliding motility lipoprotein GldH [Bacteroidota bacterium]